MRRTLLLAALAAAVPAAAQTNVTGVRLGGLGRAIVSTDRLAGDALAGDSTNARRAAGGYSLVDLAVEARPNTETEARVVLRLRTDLGGFFGDGYRFGIRELSLRGTIGERVRYTVGDTDLRLTPYTVHAPSEASAGEAEVFALRREVVRYETFDYGQNTWRLQGLRAGASALFRRGPRRAAVEAFLTRNAPTSGTVPDRLLGGGALRLDVADGVDAGATFVSLFDLDGTGTAAGLRVPVGTVDLRVARPLGAATVGLRAEAGGSRVAFEAGGPAAREDVFADAGLFATVAGVAVAAGWRDVGPRFASPAAQSRRLPYDQPPDLFPTARGLDGSRPLTVFDAMMQEDLYVTRLDARPRAFDPRLDALTPYGRATPNRRGWSLRAGRADAAPDGPAHAWDAAASLDVLREIAGEGTPRRRRFTVAGATSRLDLGRAGLLPGALTLGLRHQRVARGSAPFSVLGPDGAPALADSGAVALTSTLVDAGLTLRLTGAVDALVGLKVLAADGNEVRALYDAPTDPFAITGYTPLAYDGTETLWGAGVRVRRGDVAALSASGALLRVSDATRPAGGYRIGNLFLHYVLTF